MGDLETAINAASVTSSMRKELRPSEGQQSRSLEMKIKLNEKELRRGDDGMVNYMEEYEMTRDEKEPKIGAN